MKCCFFALRMIRQQGEKTVAFAIMRATKISGMGSVASALKHCYRDRETPNANQLLTPQNDHAGAKSTDQAMGELREQLPDKYRKDAVLVVEYMMTASPEWFQGASNQQKLDFFNESVGWLVDKYGVENVITATVHKDETTPHLSAFVVPKTADGRLSAKEFIGNKEKLSADQTSYAKRVESLGLERGVQRSRATHQQIGKYYSALNQPEKKITITADELKSQVLDKNSFVSLVLSKTVETPPIIAQRLSDKANAVIEPLAAVAAVRAQDGRRIKQLTHTVNQQQKTIERLEKPFQGLNEKQTEQVLSAVDKVAEKIRMEPPEQLNNKLPNPGRGRSRRL